MPRIVTKDLINSRLSDRGITLIGDFVRQQAKSLFRCSVGHEWIATPDNVLRRSGCPICASTKLTKEEFLLRLDQLGTIKLIGEYVDYNKTPAEFECINGHRWMSVPSFVKKRGNGTGCKACQIEAKTLTKELVIERLFVQGKGTQLIGDYLGAQTKTMFGCKNGHTWMASPDSVMGGKGCAKCATTGFNPNKESSAYIIQFDEFIKFGITNNLVNRLKSLRSNGNFVLVKSKIFESGSQALLWERSIKQLFGGKFASKQQCPDGWTETLPLSMLTEVAASLE